MNQEFQPTADEKIYVEGRASYLKSAMNVSAGYAFYTSKRYVFCDSPNGRIVFELSASDIQSAVEAKHGLTKKILLTTNAGTEYGVLGDPHEKWMQAFQHADHSVADTLGPSEEIDDGVAWHFEANGKKQGPVSTADIRQLIRNNHTVYRFTKVWRDGMPSWKPAEETELLKYFDGPPPLSGDSVNNTIVWILAFAPILGALIESMFAELRHTFVITITLNCVLALLDEHKLNNAGHNTRALGLGSAWLVPVYLFKRAKALKQNLAYFVVWVACFVLILF